MDYILGPVFRTDDLMDLLRHGNIPPPSTPSASGARVHSPMPTRAGEMHPNCCASRWIHTNSLGRPPPDYSPYQGPGGGRRTRY